VNRGGMVRTDETKRGGDRQAAFALGLFVFAVGAQGVRRAELEEAVPSAVGTPCFSPF
jgi:hypothetical protein